MQDLKISLSGIRGIAGENLTLRVVLDFVTSFGMFLKQKNPKKKLCLAVGMDYRVSSLALQHIVIGTWLSQGQKVLNLGYLPTPSLLFRVRTTNIAGAIMITASHNPASWNGLKFISERGDFLNEQELEAFLEIYKKNYTTHKDEKSNKRSDESSDEDEKKNKKDTNYESFYQLGLPILEAPFLESPVWKDHMDTLVELAHRERIQERAFRVAYDPVHGVGGAPTEYLLKKLGCIPYPIHHQIQEKWERDPEPSSENLKALENFVVAEACDLGLALDPDADRLALVSEKGKAIGEEYTLAIAIREYLKENKTNIATNSSSSRVLDDIAQENGVRLFRSSVGEANLLKTMQENQCEIGGEGNGGVILPRINAGRDAFLSMIFVFNALVREESLHTLWKSFPQYCFLKEKMKLSFSLSDLSWQKLEETIQRQYARVSLLDGIKVEEESYWFQLRKSNTEPILRLFLEAENEIFAQNKMKEFKKLVETILIDSY